jgi:DNA-binding PadR family transcriptional regulator
MDILDYHVLLALAAGSAHGYAIKDAVARESGGSLTPRAGSLYRVIARLLTDRLLTEVDPGPEAEPHPGLARRYYALTAAGRRALTAETARLKQAAALAEKRLGLARGRS